MDLGESELEMSDFDWNDRETAKGNAVSDLDIEFNLPWTEKK